MISNWLVPDEVFLHMCMACERVQLVSVYRLVRKQYSSLCGIVRVSCLLENVSLLYQEKEKFGVFFSTFLVGNQDTEASVIILACWILCGMGSSILPAAYIVVLVVTMISAVKYQ